MSAKEKKIAGMLVNWFFGARWDTPDECIDDCNAMAAVIVKELK